MKAYKKTIGEMMKKDKPKKKSTKTAGLRVRKPKKKPNRAKI